jgi:GxxExxY protein
MRDPRTYEVIGAAMEVHKQLGHGFLEAVYQEALAVEMELREIPFSREVMLPVHYKNRQLAVGYRADFLWFENVVVEIKALRRPSTIEEAQILNYLKATGLEIGILINFGSRSLEYKRYVHTKKK